MPLPTLLPSDLTSDCATSCIFMSQFSPFTISVEFGVPRFHFDYSLSARKKSECPYLIIVAQSSCTVSWLQWLSMLTRLYGAGGFKNSPIDYYEKFQVLATDSFILHDFLVSTH